MKSRFTAQFRMLCLLILAAFLTPLTLPAFALDWPPLLTDISLFDVSRLSDLIALATEYGKTDLSELAELARQKGHPELALLAERAKQAGFTDLSSLINGDDLSGIAPRYGDGHEIRYREAVDVISSIGVLNGYSDGCFRPKDGLTRGAATKIIARLSITPSDADSYPTTRNFPDVDSGHTFVRYINYCFAEKLISGYADGKFRPQDPLTYGAFLKMLLCMLGHNQDTEGYKGSGWLENVLEDARNAGLLMGLRSAFSGSDAISREVASLFALNALQANAVDSSGGIASPHKTASREAVYRNIRDVSNDGGEQIVQFGEQRFPGLVRRDASNQTVIWTLNSQRIGAYDNVSELVSYEVRFDANDNSQGVLSTKTVHNGCIYGELPSPVRPGWAFLGWFTSSVGGEERTRYSPVWLNADTTLYAHWTPTSSHTVTFRSGGKPYGPAVLIQDGDSLTEADLPSPEPTKPGCDFLGWENASTGERLSTPLRVHADLTFNAVFGTETCRVEFRAGGSVADPDAVEVAYGGSLLTLPVLGYDAAARRQFDCWTHNGTPVSAPLTVLENLTLDARWTEVLSVMDVSYRFSNSYEGFGYGNGYVIPKERYQLMYGNNILAKTLYELDWNASQATWYGNCYGMITTIGLFLHSGNDILIANFRNAASCPWDLSPSDGNAAWNLTLTEFIEAMQIAQKTPSFVRAYWEHLDSLTSLCDAVSRFARTGDNPVVICVWGRTQNGVEGHALLGYSLDEQYSDAESRLYVYDPNHPGDAQRYITLKKSVDGGYSAWQYHFNQISAWGSGYPDSAITYIPYENYRASWENRGSADNAMLNLNTAIKNIAIYDEQEREIASFTDGVVDDMESAVRNGVYPAVPPVGGGSASDCVSVWIPAGRGYRIENRDPSSRGRITLSNVDVSLTLNTSAIETYLSLGKDKVLINPVDDSSADYDIKVNDARKIPDKFTMDFTEYAKLLTMLGLDKIVDAISQILPTRDTTTIDGEEIPTVRGRTCGVKIVIDLSTGEVRGD